MKNLYFHDLTNLNHLNSLQKRRKLEIKGNYMKHKANLDKKYLHAVLCCKISVNNLFLSDIIHSFADLNSKLNKLARGNCLGKKINSKFLFKDLTHSTFLYLCNLHWSNDQRYTNFWPTIPTISYSRLSPHSLLMLFLCSHLYSCRCCS